MLQSRQPQAQKFKADMNMVVVELVEHNISRCENGDRNEKTEEKRKKWRIQGCKINTE